MNILMVEDDDTLRRVCVRVLEREGHTVAAADSAEKALDAVSRQEFDLMVTDVGLPGIHGDALAVSVRRSHPQTDVIIVTGAPGVDTAVPTLKAGASDYLVKPFAPRDLAAAAARCQRMRELSPKLNRELALSAELTEAYKQLAEAEGIEDAILSRVQHELRTPITVAKMALAALEECGGDERSRKFQATIGKRLQVLEGRIEELLSLQRVACGAAILKRAPCSISATVQSLLERYAPLIEERAIQVKLDLPDEEVDDFDPAMLKELVEHLLRNAIQFNHPAGWVKIMGVLSPEELRFSVSDSGIGIAPEIQENIFRPFYQAADHLTRQVGGLGVGLALVRGIAQAHGGGASVESRPEGGSVFHVRLPLLGSRS